MTRTHLVRLVLVLALSATVAAQDAHELYQRGLVEENARGNLKEAIDLYEQVARAAGPDRALAARALIRAAASREKLGQRAEAATAYAEVIRAYPEQRAEAGLAQARLAALRAEQSDRAPRTAAASRTDVSSSTAALFERYCVQCHRAGNRSGGLDLTALDDRDIASNTAPWERIVQRLQARRDPPAGLPRPDETTYRAVVATLETALDGAYSGNPTLHGAERATGTELAERIAALIWNAPPDASLLEDARHGRLHDAETLNRQVARMLRDQRSSGLVDGFFTKWLSLDRIKGVKPDPSRYPQFDAELLQAMQSETRLFVESQIREDHDAVELWTADYTYVNERLARLYGIAGVTGSEFRRITWPNDERAGILGQAGLLAALSVGGRTSPTTRGRFILSRFIGVDPPDPPANVPALAEHPPTPGTMRDRLQAHKLIPSCARCHAMFDPLGLALENFDAVGAWRTTDGGAPIDASGTFVDGRRFNGPAELRAGLLKYRDAYYTTVTERLLAYALHRTDKSVLVYDYEMPAVRRIVRDASLHHYRWSAILAGVAASAPFQMKHLVP